MKRIYFTLAIVVLGSWFSLAQNSGKGFNYQAVARDINGQVIQNESVILQFGLYSGQFASEPTWQEMQLANTDDFGAFSLTVGHGQKSGGTVDTYEELNYGSADYWLKVELKDGETYHEISFRELMSVPYAEVARNAMPNPTGTILPFAGNADAVPDGYLLCDGALLDKNAYPQLYAVLGNSWGGNTTDFNLPDCRGMFLRGASNGSDNDPDNASRIASNSGGNTGDNVGSKQLSENLSHSHTMQEAGEHSHWFGSGRYALQANSDGSYSTGGTDVTVGEPDVVHKHGLFPSGDHTHVINPGGGSESRPVNVYVNYIIKY